MENAIVKYSEAKEINRIIGSVPVEYTGFETAFYMAAAIRDLRVVFDQKNVRDVVESMIDTRLGFKTDQRDGDSYRKPIKYEWPQIKECVIDALLSGYRITGNEFNIIGGNMYPTKEGKYRKIIEFPGLESFKPTTTPAQFFEEERSGYKGKREMFQLAKVQCFATWILNGEPQKIGHDEDKLPFKIKVNVGMGDDAIIGKALSRLYTRVLMRLTGVSVPESDDVYAPEAEIVMTPNEIREKKYGLPPMPDEKPKKSVADLERPLIEPINLKEMGFKNGSGTKKTTEKKSTPSHLVCRNEDCGAYAGLRLLSGCKDPTKWDSDGENGYLKNSKCEEFQPAKIAGLFTEIGETGIKAARKATSISELSGVADQWKVYEYCVLGGAK